jgi:hypothetical protein
MRADGRGGRIHIERAIIGSCCLIVVEVAFLVGSWWVYGPVIFSSTLLMLLLKRISCKRIHTCTWRVSTSRERILSTLRLSLLHWVILRRLIWWATSSKPWLRTTYIKILLLLLRPWLLEPRLILILIQLRRGREMRSLLRRSAQPVTLNLKLLNLRFKRELPGSIRTTLRVRHSIP